MNECNHSSICQNGFKSFALSYKDDADDDGDDNDGDDDDDDDDNINRKAALKLHLPQSYSPMHSSHTKDCTAQKTI